MPDLNSSLVRGFLDKGRGTLPSVKKLETLKKNETVPFNRPGYDFLKYLREGRFKYRKFPYLENQLELKPSDLPRLTSNQKRVTAAMGKSRSYKRLPGVDVSADARSVYGAKLKGELSAAAAYAKKRRIPVNMLNTLKNPKGYVSPDVAHPMAASTGKYPLLFLPPEGKGQSLYANLWSGFKENANVPRPTRQQLLGQLGSMSATYPGFDEWAIKRFYPSAGRKQLYNGKNHFSGVWSERVPTRLAALLSDTQRQVYQDTGSRLTSPKQAEEFFNRYMSMPDADFENSLKGKRAGMIKLLRDLRRLKGGVHVGPATKYRYDNLRKAVKELTPAFAQAQRPRGIWPYSPRLTG